MKILCPHCKEPVHIDIAKALDEDGEVFLCNYCLKKFRYAPNG